MKNVADNWKMKRKEQEAIIEQNRGLGALFGEKAKKRKAAQVRIEEINKELEKLWVKR